MNHLNDALVNITVILIMVSIETAVDPALSHIRKTVNMPLHVWNRPFMKKSVSVDICTRYSSMQYLLILYEPDETQIPKVMDRIFQYFDTLYDKKDFIPSYEYRPILHSND